MNEPTKTKIDARSPRGLANRDAAELAPFRILL